MSVKGVIHRYFTIVETVKSRKSIAPGELLNKLISDGFEITQRTLQRDIEALRDEFGIELIKDSFKRYLLNDEDPEELAKTIEILGKLAISGYLEDLLKQKNIREKIHLSTTEGYQGISHIKNILYAVSNNIKLRIIHKKFESDTPLTMLILPHLLKEYQGRWYLSAWVENMQDFRTFGLERIESLELLPDKFIRKGDPSSLFDKAIGVVYNPEPQRIELSYTPEQGKYIKTLPLHPSQVLEFENEDECRVSLFVSPNYELTQRILMDGANVKVISPNWLVKDIKGIAKRMLNQYS